MKIMINSDINMIIFLSKEYLKIDLKNTNDLEDYFKELFLTLKNVYDIKINGYYDIDVYIDKHYGVVLELVKEELDYIDYYDNEVDMRIVIHESDFMYSIEDCFFTKNMDIYLYKNKIYGKINEYLNSIDMGKILENGEIVYKDINKIIKYGKRLEV